MARPFRQFREYDFFGILLPGLASVIFLYFLLPQEIQIGFSQGIVFVGVFAFIFGQALHAAALFVEVLPEMVSRLLGISWSHRTKFQKELNDPSYFNKRNIRAFQQAADRVCPGFSARSSFDDEYSTAEALTLYAFVRSYLHAHNQSRASSIKAIYGFCRNMFVLLLGLVPLYLTYGFLSFERTFALGVSGIGYIDRPGKYQIFFSSFTEFLRAVVPLALLGASIFLIGMFLHQRFFIQYLISDFLAVCGTDRTEDGD